MDARDPFAFSPALQPGQFSLNSSGTPVKNSLSRQQFGATLSFPIVKNKTFLFAGYEGLRSDAEDSVPLLTKSRIFSPTAAQLPIIEALANDPGNPLVPAFLIFHPGRRHFFPPPLALWDCRAFSLSTLLPARTPSSVQRNSRSIDSLSTSSKKMEACSPSRLASTMVPFVWTIGSTIAIKRPCDMVLLISPSQAPTCKR